MQLHRIVHFGGQHIVLLDDRRGVFIGISLATRIVFIFPFIRNYPFIEILMKIRLEGRRLVRCLYQACRIGRPFEGLSAITSATGCPLKYTWSSSNSLSPRTGLAAPG